MKDYKNIENQIKKTYKEWQNSDTKYLEEFLNIGDLVDEEFINYFTEVLPPLIINNYMLQVSEICDYVEGENTYTTFIRTKKGWIYAGECHKGKTENKIR